MQIRTSVQTTKQKLSHKGCSSPLLHTANKEVRPLKATLMLIIWQLSLPLALHQLNLISEFRASPRTVVPVQEWRMVTVTCIARFPRNAELIKSIFEGTAIPCVLLCKTFQVISCLHIAVCPSVYLQFSPVPQLIHISISRTENSIRILDLPSVRA